MSYQVLARKWRPKSFEQLMGQEHVVTVLVNALTQNRLHHAYLFTGTRGVGKTTIARIFAKSLNCEIGITATPCGKCNACIDIDRGAFVDLLEIDAASRTKVDDTREILDNVQYAPSRGRFKVYLIDEIHMLSRHSFNALLKTLEEPPEHVKFILATTDPQKLPVTVLSRCLQFHLKALTVQQIQQQLETILAAENVTCDGQAVNILAKAARGSMRDSLSLTDQAIAQGQGEISVANVQKMLGGVDHNWVYKILIALIKQDSKHLMELSQDIASYAPSYTRLLAELIQLLHQIAMKQVVIDANFDLSTEHQTLLQKFAKTMSPEDVQLYYQIVLNGRKDLPYAADEQAAFDMVLLRLLAFKPSENVNYQVASVQQESSEPFNDILPDTNVADKVQEHKNVKLPHQDAPVKDEYSNRAELEPVADIDPVTPDIPTPDVSEQQLHQDIENIEQQASAMMASTSENTTVPARSPETSIEAKQQHHTEIQHDAHSQAETTTAQIKDSAVNETSDVDILTSSDTPPSIASALATRNILRSRKNEAEKDAKKSDDAKTRQLKQEKAHKDTLKEKAKAELPELETVPEQPFNAQQINPEVIKAANQVDRWAHMIDTMALGGRLRQLAIHATVDKNSTDDNLKLLLNQSTKHLKTDVAHQQLESEISEYLQRKVVVDIIVVEETTADPYQIQSHINDKRYDYAVELLKKDEIVIAFQTQFQAELDESTIVAR